MTRDEHSAHLEGEPTSEPEWTPDRLRTVLMITYGTNAAGTGPDLGAVAAAIGVTSRTVRRWIQHNRPSGVSAQNLARVLADSRPSEEALRDEASRRRYAEDASARIELPRGMGGTDMWRQQGWLEPHVLAILEVPELPLRRPVITRATAKALDRLPKKRMVDHTLCQHRFAAELVKASLLEHVDAWRIQAPDGTTGRTETWLADAPLPPLPATHD